MGRVEFTGAAAVHFFVVFKDSEGKTPEENIAFRYVADELAAMPTIERAALKRPSAESDESKPTD